MRWQRVTGVALVLAFATAVWAQPRIDPVLLQMVPTSPTSLVGAHMDQVKQTEIYKKLLSSQSLGQLDQFASETGFDPRRDVKELLFTTSGAGSVMLARGTFRVRSDAMKNAKKIRHGDYEIVTSGKAGFCVLDATLAVAGDLDAVTAALDEWKSGKHNAAQALLTRVATISPQSQLWGLSTGTGNFLVDHPPGLNTGLDFSKIFRGLRETWFQANLSTGFRAEVHGTTATEQDALNLKDAVRGLVGLGRLNVPEDQPELLKIWDGIGVDQQGRSVSIKVDIPQDLIDKMVQILTNGTRAVRKVI